MSRELMFIPRQVLVFSRVTFLTLMTSVVCFGNYQTFDLPASKLQKIPATELQYKSEKLQLKPGKVRFESPSVNKEDYVFAKRAFVSKKRDEAIKMLRQQMDSGGKGHLDNILLRLGQLYTERYMELSYLESELYGKELEVFDKRGKKGKPPKLQNSRSQRNLNEALKIFSRLEKEYPRHYKIDEVIFFIGFVNMEFGKRKKGMQYLGRVVRRYPKSRKYEEAVLYIGDYNFDRNRYKQAYEKFRILSRRKNSPLYHYASYKMAWSELNLGKKRQGLKRMQSLVSGLKGEEGKARFNLRTQAINDLMVFYVDLEIVDEAVRYFERVVGEEKALANLKIMAAQWLAKAMDRSAIRAYTLLVKKFGESAEAPKLQMALFDARARLGQNKRGSENLAQALAKFNAKSSWLKDLPEGKQKEGLDNVAGLKEQAVKAALFYHHTAQKTKNKSYYGYALNLYAALTQNFPNLKERRKYSFFRAEILFSLGKHLEAANVYMELAKNPPQDKLAKDAAYNALLAVDAVTAKQKSLKRYSKKEQQNLSVSKQDIPEQEKRFLDVATFFMLKYPKHPKIVEVKFRIASIYYQFHHFDKALKGYEDIAVNHSRHKSAQTSAHIVLDIHNIRKDYKSLHASAGVFAAKKSLGGPGFRKEMALFRKQIEFKKIEKLEADNKWKEAGQAYFKYYSRNTRGALAEQSLYNAVVSFEKSKSGGDFNRVSSLFLRKYPKHSYSKHLLLRRAQHAEKIYQFELAQESYWKFYQLYPKDREAKKALFNAALFAELLGQHQRAIKLYDQYSQLRGVSWKQKRAIKLSKAKINVKRRHWTKAIASYDELQKTAQTIEERVAFWGEMITLYGRLGQRTKRNKLLKRLVRFSRGKNPKSFGKGITFVAEGKYRQIADQKKAYQKIRLRLPPATLVKNLKRKQQALARLDKAYDAVVAFGEPMWGVAALHDKALAYQQFVKSYRSIRIPRSYKGAQRKELKKEMKVIDDQAIAPLEAQALKISKTCVDKGKQFYVASSFLEGCVRQSKTLVALPEGLKPRPAYWTTGWTREGVARK